MKNALIFIALIALVLALYSYINPDTSTLDFNDILKSALDFVMNIGRVFDGIRSTITDFINGVIDFVTP